ncbi:MAG: 2,3-bisphosphoglycerate-independent phosphoglycerate mutase [Aestuariivita sp.]|nr:2,3-bisphosphoglycerate-independent phosphoglycerate mutase [Aestuariivita sp.]
MTSRKPIVLCILDGWGLSNLVSANAPVLAQTPHYDHLAKTAPFAKLVTHGRAVGLPDGQMGNSEVGHSTIGAGRVIERDLMRINQAIEDRSFMKNPKLRDFIRRLKSSSGTAHLVGIMSDGGVHGHIAHVISAAQEISSAGISVALHAISDGRDVPPQSASKHLRTLQNALTEGITVATLIGRYFAMDRDNRWDRIYAAYRAIVSGEGRQCPNLQAAVATAYDRGETDEFIAATVLGPYNGMRNGDGLFCLNFRADRSRQLLSAIAQPDSVPFTVSKHPKLSALLGLIDYSRDHSRYFETVFPDIEVPNSLGSWIAQHNRRQFRIAETEKYPHVTFFFNGGKEEPEVGEDRFMAASPDVPTYDRQPEMSASEVTQELVAAIHKDYDFIVVNYANPDMVGHTGDLDAAICACEAVDAGLGQAIQAVHSVDGAMIVTSDHGNCETMINPETGNAHTAHTLNLVPIFLVSSAPNLRLNDGKLSDIAPTILDLMSLPIPPEMTGQSLLEST